jgi:hypothetical protein
VVTKSRTAGWVFLPLEIRSPDRNLGLHMMAEYVALSSVMRELLPLNRLVKTAAQIVTGDDNNKIVTKSDVHSTKDHSKKSSLSNQCVAEPQDLSLVPRRYLIIRFTATP